ncbi:WD40-repeat-containing domain protein [Chaetomidium leptoderma]|uniref:WD40-repeat-containing domain protein n=1 Tax=Chaetomidium leptoderma TaxID=669021 RepID=A0AAN6VHQ5_9PEZI|nr:WD40-repeat-containing domain protein [Chaetomidium leptoderma]
MMHPSRRAYVEEAEPEVTIDRDYDIPGAGAGIAPEKASALLSQFERKRLAATIAVPTDDGRVRARLRELGQPVTLFGEGPADRRDRLRELLTEQAHAATGQEGVDVEMMDAEKEEEDEAEEQEEEFYSRGTDELLQARIDIAQYSIPRAKRRIEFQKKEATIPLRTHVKFRKEVKERLQSFELQGSQTAGDRHVSMTRISPNGKMVATGNWGGQHKRTLRGHTNKISGISWMPGATLPESNISEQSVNLASGGAEGQIHLWSLSQDTPLSTLSGHSQRVCRVEFHPSGKYLASASEDTSWRLWDVETTTELLLQEGHSRGVYAVSFSTDGSLLASGGLDSIGRIWDLRSGRTVMILDGGAHGHIKPIYGLDWGSDGHRVLTASADGWVKCWDVRKVQRSGGIGAHTSAVSDVRWFKGLDDPVGGNPPGEDEKGMQIPKKSGTFLVSAGFDHKVNIFSADDWGLVQSLSGHTGPVASVDVSRDGRWIVSGGHDRTVKLWGRNDSAGINMSTMDRYRPPREGYQPPSLPLKPLPAAIERLSKSPSRRRDVPPAVPSPPTHTSRTSPPRPHSRRSAASPGQPSPPRAPQPRPNQWFFTADEVASTPSIVEGLPQAEERLRRAKGVNFIFQAGVLLELPQVTLWVASVFFHRFYMIYSMMEEKGGIHHYNIAATALFLANKTEENCRKTKDLIIAVAKVAQKNTKLIIDEQSKEYWKWRDSILAYEEVMLETLTFDLMVDSPYQRLFDYVNQLELRHNKPVRDAAWAFCNDACLTVLPLMLNARDMAIAAIFFATSISHEKIDDVKGEPWWQFLKGSETTTVRAAELMTEFYKENPLRKQDAKVPGSPKFNLESTRRRGELSLSQMDLDSSQYGTPTPLGTDRGGTQSPRPGARLNGKAERERGDSKEVTVKKEDPSDSSSAKIGDEPAATNSEEQLASQVSNRGDSDAALKVAANDLSTHDGRSSTLNRSAGGGLISPRIKRRSTEPEEGEEREAKRMRLDEDEGEIQDS